MEIIESYINFILFILSVLGIVVLIWKNIEK